MTINIKSNIIESNSQNEIELCANNPSTDQNLTQSETSKINDCCLSYPITIGHNTANFNDRVTTKGTNGGSSAYGCYDMMGQVDEWLHNINDNRDDVCNTTYMRANRFGGSDDTFTGEEVKTNSYINQGVRFVSQVPNIKIYNKNKQVIPDSSGNTINSNNKSNWDNSLYGNMTSIGTNGRPSYWGTFDQGGLVWEYIVKEDRDILSNFMFHVIQPHPMSWVCEM